MVISIFYHGYEAQKKTDFMEKSMGFDETINRNLQLVGGLEHEWIIFPNSWNDNPIWFSYFFGGVETTD